MTRKVADCRDFPSETGCTLTIAGTESEVLDAALLRDRRAWAPGHAGGP
jgi:hypothetical protein